MSTYRLLVVDDDEGIVNLVAHAAHELGFIVQSITGSDIEKAYHKFKPDAIVLDVLMPDKDGIEVLQYLKDQHPRLHVLILSGSPDSYRRIAHSLGRAVGFVVHGDISKPFRISELRAALNKIKTALDEAAQPDRDAM